jgi:type IX secretion system PorP/SprF family membrane protein
VQYGINTSSLITTDNISSDATFNEKNLKRIVPDFGLGLMYKSDKFYIGVTVPHLLQSKIKFINEVVDTTGMNIGKRNTFAQIFRHYYTTAGVNININDDFKVQPAVLVRYVINAPLVADFNTNVVYKDFLWAGAGYRISNFGAIIAMLGVNISDRFKVGYAFNMTTGGVSSFTGTSHEIMINYHVAIESSNKGNRTKVKKFKGSSKKPYFLK